MNEKRDRGRMGFANLAARTFYVAEMIAAVVCMGIITFFMAMGISSAMMMGRISQFKMWPDIVFAAIFMTAAAAGFRVAYVGFRYGFKGEEAEGCKKLCVLSMALFGIFDLLVILMMVLFAVVPDLSDDVTSVLQPMILSGMIGLLATFPELPAVGILLALCTSGEEAGKRENVREQEIAGDPMNAGQGETVEKPENEAGRENTEISKNPVNRKSPSRERVSPLRGTILFGLFVACSIVFIFTGQRSAADVKTDAFTGFHSVDLAGNPEDESIFAGHELTMINVWGTFCEPCKGEMPDLAELNETYKDRGFQVVGVCADVVNAATGETDPQKLSEAIDLTAQLGADNYLHLNPEGELDEKFCNEYATALPTSLFVNSRGEQVGRMVIGSLNKEGWISEIEQRLEMVENGTDEP